MMTRLSGLCLLTFVIKLRCHNFFTQIRNQNFVFMKDHYTRISFELFLIHSFAQQYSQTVERLINKISIKLVTQLKLSLFLDIALEKM